MRQSRRSNGFTLIEVAVALAILSWVLGSAIYLVSQYGDERFRLRERFFATQVSWNRLMERHQYAQGWVPASERSELQSKGVDDQLGRGWRWELSVEEAAGEDLYRYEVKAGAEGSAKFSSALALYLVNDGS